MPLNWILSYLVGGKVVESLWNVIVVAFTFLRKLSFLSSKMKVKKVVCVNSYYLLLYNNRKFWKLETGQKPAIILSFFPFKPDYSSEICQPLNHWKSSISLLPESTRSHKLHQILPRLKSSGVWYRSWDLIIVKPNVWIFNWHNTSIFWRFVIGW